MPPTTPGLSISRGDTISLGRGCVEETDLALVKIHTEENIYDMFDEGVVDREVERVPTKGRTD